MYNHRWQIESLPCFLSCRESLIYKFSPPSCSQPPKTSRTVLTTQQARPIGPLFPRTCLASVVQSTYVSSYPLAQFLSMLRQGRIRMTDLT